MTGWAESTQQAQAVGAAQVHVLIQVRDAREVAALEQGSQEACSDPFRRSCSLCTWPSAQN
jgi:hypothetical protein